MYALVCLKYVCNLYTDLQEAMQIFYVHNASMDLFQWMCSGHAIFKGVVILYKQFVDLKADLKWRQVAYN